MTQPYEGYSERAPDGLFVEEIELLQVDSNTDQEDPDSLRADIAETRDRMGDTLGEIGERLNPHRVTEQVKDSIREATIGRVENMAQQAASKVNETKRGIVDTIRDNPVPAAMVGLGLGWMMWNGRSDSSATSSRSTNAYRNPRDAQRFAQGSGYSGRGGANAGAYGSTDFMSDEAGGVVDTIREKAGDLGDTVKDAAGGLADRAQDMAGNVTQGTRSGARRVEDAFHDSPLLTGVLTLALGLAAGLAAPPTHPEVALMGDARDQLGDHVHDVVDETKQKVEHVAQRAIDETKNAAREEGLSTP